MRSGPDRIIVLHVAICYLTLSANGKQFRYFEENDIEPSRSWPMLLKMHLFKEMQTRGRLNDVVH
jgi:hypothetical protein